MKKNNKILLVEDDVNLGLVIQDFLELKGYEVILARDGDEGWDKFYKGEFCICILDVMMPKKDGYTLAKEIRAKDENIPIIFLTARSQKEDRITGFRIGADDYVTKPFSTEELHLRIEAILRRTQNTANTEEADEIYILGKYVFNYSDFSLKYEDEKQELTRREAELLRYFCKNKNKVLPREVLQKAVWGNDDYFTGRSMDVFIARLRKYLKKDSNILIQNLHGTGFKLVAE